MKQNISDVIAYAITASVSFGAFAKPIDPQQDGIYRWRLYTDKDKSFLFSASYDNTDQYGPISFRCKNQIGLVEVEVGIDEEDRKKLGEILKDDDVSVIFPDSDYIMISKITRDEMRGWNYYFEISEETKQLDVFEKSGSFHVKVGKLIDSAVSLKKGLVSIAKFRQQCRKPLPKKSP